MSDLPGLDEARTAALLSDAHIVTVYDFQVVGGMAYLIMEYVEGMTLTRFLDEHDADLSLDIIAAIFGDVAHALSVAHGAGVLHLDIKPDNVLIDKRGQVKVTDFGLATLVDAQGFGLAGGGTIGYMPPEQMRQEDLDARTDEWALASIAYEMLTGKNPFLASTLAQAQAAVEDAELVLPSLCWSGIRPAVDDVIFKALDLDRSCRYDSVAEFADALMPCLGDAADGHRVLAEFVGGAEAGALIETAVPGSLVPAGVVPADESAALRASVAAAYVPSVAVPKVYPPADPAPAPLPEPGDTLKGARTTASRAGGHFFGIWARILGFFLCTSLMLLACVNMPMFSTFSEPMIQDILERIWPAALDVPALQNSFLWMLVVVSGVLAAIKPSWGALFALLGVGVAVTWKGNVWMGLAFILVLALWWYCTGRHGGSQANCGLAYPVLGAAGFSPFAPLATGIGMRVLDAAMTALFGIFTCMLFASFGSGDIMNWHLAANWEFSAHDLPATLGITVASLPNWIIAAGWFVAAVVGGLCTMPRKRWINIMGAVLAAVCICISVAAATWVGSAHATWVPETWVLVKVLICCAVGIGAACLFVPEPYLKKRAPRRVAVPDEQ
ncbi:MAG: serine/threonine protein kinase [Eggerthellaceae bacterium]|nr:serine/threonine protein kinase [Eggerthellaceae bacterium]